MLSRKWLEKEGLVWVDKGIVSREQYEAIIGLYDERKATLGILPILGGLLVGLGVLSFVAANWQQIAQGLRLAIILAFMTGCYVWGNRWVERGQQKLGIALVGTGLMSFGAGLFLIAQMYQLTSSNVFALVLWAVFGMMLTVHYRSRFLFMISVVIFLIAQITSMSDFHSLSYLAFVLYAVVLLPVCIRHQNEVLLGIWTVGLLVQILMLIEDLNWHWSWLVALFAAVYSAGDWPKQPHIRRPVQTVVLAGGILFAAWVVIFYDIEGLFGPQYDAPIWLLAAFVVLLPLSLLGKKRNGTLLTSLDWLLFLPLFLIKTGTGFWYLAVMFLFSLFVLAMGYREHGRSKINIGTALFLFTTFIAYTKLSWAFMNKSLFFLVGGIMLLALSWLLNKRKRDVLDGEGGDRHGD